MTYLRVKVVVSIELTVIHWHGEGGHRRRGHGEGGQRRHGEGGQCRRRTSPARGRGPAPAQDRQNGMLRAASRLSKFGFVKGTSNSLRIHRTGTLQLVECLIQLVFICVRKQGQRTDSSAYPPLYVLARQTGQKRVGDAGSSRATCTLPQ